MVTGRLVVYLNMLDLNSFLLDWDNDIWLNRLKC